MVNTLTRQEIGTVCRLTNSIRASTSNGRQPNRPWEAALCHRKSTQPLPRVSQGGYRMVPSAKLIHSKSPPRVSIARDTTGHSAAAVHLANLQLAVCACSVGWVGVPRKHLSGESEPPGSAHGLQISLMTEFVSLKLHLCKDGSASLSHSAHPRIHHG